MLDNETNLDDAYRLEVTTPGLERNLRRPEHYKKSVGREVVAKIQREESRRTIRGVIKDAGESTFTVEGSDDTEIVSYDEVIKAKTVFRWEKAPKPGH
jgi:ribosome maturation factor RimP